MTRQLKNVSLGEIAKTLNNTQSVQNVSLADLVNNNNINKFAKYKPVQSTSYTSQLPDTKYEEKNYGLSVTTWTASSPNGLVSITNAYGLSYNKPTSKFRLSDWAGYVSRDNYNFVGDALATVKKLRDDYSYYVTAVRPSWPTVDEVPVAKFAKVSQVYRGVCIIKKNSDGTLDANNIYINSHEHLYQQGNYYPEQLILGFDKTLNWTNQKCVIFPCFCSEKIGSWDAYNVYKMENMKDKQNVQIYSLREMISNEITIHWEEQVVTNVVLTLNYNGGTLNGKTQEGCSVQKGTALVNILQTSGLTKTGYSLKGWSTSTNGNLIDTSKYNINSNVTLYAIWEINTYSVKFYVNDSLQSNQTVKYQQSATAPNVYNNGSKIFIGWDKSFNNITSDLIVNAVFKSINVSFTLYNSGGTNGGGSYCDATIVDMKSELFGGPGDFDFLFLGGGTNALNITQGVVSTHGKYDITYSNKETVVLVELDYNNFTNTILQNSSVIGTQYVGVVWSVTLSVDGTPYEYQQRADENYYYIRQVANTSSSFGTYYADNTQNNTYILRKEKQTQIITGLTLFGYDDSDSGSFDYTYEGTIPFSKNSATEIVKVQFVVKDMGGNPILTLHSNSGSFGQTISKQITCQAGQTVYLSSYTPTRTHYTFKGWATTNNAQYPSYTSTYTMPSTNATLYAVWQEQCKITLSGFITADNNKETGYKYYDQGTVNLANVAYEILNISDTNNIKKKYKNQPSDYYKLLGWSTNQNATIPMNIITLSTNVTLYAVFEIQNVICNMGMFYSANVKCKQSIKYGYGENSTTYRTYSNAWDNRVTTINDDEQKSTYNPFHASKTGNDEYIYLIFDKRAPGNTTSPDNYIDDIAITKTLLDGVNEPKSSVTAHLINNNYNYSNGFKFQIDNDTNAIYTIQPIYRHFLRPQSASSGVQIYESYRIAPNGYTYGKVYSDNSSSLYGQFLNVANEITSDSSWTSVTDSQGNPSLQKEGIKISFKIVSCTANKSGEPVFGSPYTNKIGNYYINCYHQCLSRAMTSLKPDGWNEHNGITTSISINSGEITLTLPMVKRPTKYQSKNPEPNLTMQNSGGSMEGGMHFIKVEIRPTEKAEKIILSYTTLLC